MEIKHIDGYDCIDDNLNIVLKGKNVDIREIFSDLWYFEFNENSELLGKGLMTSNDNKYEKLKEKFNIDYIIYENKNRNNNIVLKDLGVVEKLELEKIDKIIQENCNESNVIIVEVDTFKYKFDKGFQKYNGTHSVILTEKIDNKAKIIDVWYKLYNIEMDYYELLNSITRIVILNISRLKQKSFDKNEFKSYILSEKSIIEMKKFFKKLPGINLKKEYMDLDFEMVFKAPIDKGLRKVIMNRQRFAYYLYYIGEKLNKKEITNIGDYMFAVSMEWVKIRSILVQSFFLNKNLKTEQIVEITDNILKKELKIKKEIEELIW